MRNPDNALDKKVAYGRRLATLTDQELFDEAKQKIWLSAYANDNPDSCYHWQADACSDESDRREGRIYNHAWRATYRGTIGHDPHPDEGQIVETWAGREA